MAENTEGWDDGVTVSASPMMDPQAEEVQRAVAALPRVRVAYALETLIDEVTSLFPETTYDIIDRNGRGTGVSASFSTHECDGLKDLLLLIEDPRIEGVVYDHREAIAFVAVWNNPRTMDSREPFNLADAWLVLSESGAADSGESDLLDEGASLDDDTLPVGGSS